MRKLIPIFFLVMASSLQCFAGSDHASLKAYPDAITSIEDPATRTAVFVDGSGQNLIAVNARDGSYLWSVNIIGFHTPEAGEPVIRHLEIKNGQIIVTAGKHCIYQVDLKTGTAKFVGCD